MFLQKYKRNWDSQNNNKEKALKDPGNSQDFKDLNSKS